MNIKFLLTLFCAILIFQNCKKSEEPAFFTTKEDLVPRYFLPGSFICTAKKEVPGLGSIDWTANIAAAVKDRKLNMTFLTYQDAVNLDIRERLSFAYIPVAIGRTNMGNNTSQPFSTYSRWFADGDVLGASWDIDTAQMNNFMELTQIDTISRIITGKFTIHFKMIMQGSFGFVHSERINFKNGNFTMKY